MNHCLLEVTVQKAPTVRYTQDNKTAIAEMQVLFEGLRNDDSPGELKVVGWGNLAQELQGRVQVGQRLLLEGRLRMNTVPRQDGTKEKRAEFTLSKLHPISDEVSTRIDREASQASNASPNSIDQPEMGPTKAKEANPGQEGVSWNSSPLVPDTDEIPF